MEILEDNRDFQEILQKQDRFFLLKHSLTCPISAEAKQQFETFSETTELPLYILHVQEARPLSNEIADSYGIKHESPQALLFNQSQVVWDASHWDVTREALTEAETKYANKKEPNS
ncbi:bacillithiol system redox-active protein YtxJ [Virgibacillus sp. MSP4-1]|uniref:bacillithiol system redox-active protein YtxJ n=1 Tax=Virgibacillus sp. MSP4-1 TaxID=2700081 RepID=UPI0003A8B5BE|nr:bacillithiol system redox-active protein YtxJ [Virgibacillus sp. MSP4-1]QHS23050.1 bacillithiol system redox-active protein YtxJ [Virgibacillus sp. MSP4-1]